MADGITFNPPNPKTGDKVIVTVTLAGRKKSDTFNYATAAGNLTQTLTTVADGTLTHTQPGTITPVSDDGTVAVYTVQY